MTDPSLATRRALTRDALGLAIAAGVYAVSFGVLSTLAGLSVLQTCVLSLIMFTGASQFSFIGVIATGGSPFSGVATALLLGARNSLYGMRMAATLDLRGWRRPVMAHLVIDETTAMAVRHADRASSRYAFTAAGTALFTLWNLGTLVGALAGPVIGDPETFGLDAAVPAAFVALLWPQLPDLTARLTAVGAVALTLALVPVVPVGVPVLAAALIAVAAGLLANRREAVTP